MRKWMPLLTISAGTFMLLIDVTIVNVALPDIATDLKTGLGDLQWVIDIYALALAALLLGIGSAADRFGHKRVYVVGVAVFALSSLACALSTGSSSLIAARGVQGVGAGAMFATTIALLNSAYRGKERGIAFGVWGATNGVATATGPILGGLLTEQFGWQSIFYVNLPISVVAIALAVFFLDESKDPRARIDPAGVVTFTLAAGALTYGLIRAADDGWGKPAPLLSFAVAVLALVAFLLVERVRSYPMLDLKLFKRPAFTALMVAAVTIQAGAFSAMAYSSLWLQSILGRGPIAAGAVFLPLSLVALVTSVLTGRLLHDRLPAGLLVGIGGVLVAIGTGLQAFVSSDSSWSVLVPGLAVLGLGVGIVMPTMSSAATAAAPRERGGMAGGALNTFRQLGYVLGIAIFGAVFANRVESSVAGNGSVPSPGKVADLLTGGQARVVTASAPAGQRALVDQVVHTAFATGLRWIYLIAAGIALVGAVLTLLLTRGRRAAAVEPGAHPAADSAGEPGPERSGEPGPERSGEPVAPSEATPAPR